MTPKPSLRPSAKATSKKRVAEAAEAPQVEARQITVRGRANQMPFLEVAGAETNDGARATTHAWSDEVLGRNQWWIMHRLADGNIALESAIAPGKVLTLNQELQGAVWPANPGASSQGTVALEQEDLPDSQRWKLVSTGDGWSQLVSAVNGQWCLYDRVTLNEPVMVNTCDAGKVWQQWVIGEGPSSPVPSIP
ncbi:RICIN domain-containing protein [Streptomyces chartreusis]|uniref:RICIN domain-containing protein n=1 Tax=Streptomyces chartreusis TaxID=1969 RepID=UPI0038033332